MILRKTGIFDATRCQILRLTCTKFYFRWGSAPDPTGGAYSAPPDPLAVFKGAYGEREGKGEREDEGRGRWGEGFAGPMSNCFLRASNSLAKIFYD